MRWFCVVVVEDIVHFVELNCVFVRVLMWGCG